MAGPTRRRDPVAVRDRTQEDVMSAREDVDRPSADAESEIQVRHRPEDHVYAAVMAGRQIASFHYDIVGGRIIVLTTTVASEFRGRGIAPDLIADALDDLRGLGMPFTVRCPVVSEFIARNPQYADLIAPVGETA
jgi:predicted GNAT family acetyltransferase